MKIIRVALLFPVSILLQQTLIGGVMPDWAVGWGANTGGEATGIPTSAATAYSSGTVQVEGHPLTNIVAISAGQWHSLALTADGMVFGWGNNSSGEVAGFKTDYAHSQTNGLVRIGGSTLSGVKAISAGSGLSLGLKSDGTVVAWGSGPTDKVSSAAVVPAEARNIVAISAGGDFSLALTANGSVIGWGTVNVPSGLSNIVAIAAGRGHNSPGLALRKDGTVLEWDSSPEHADGMVVVSNAVAISIGGGHCLSLLKDGTVFGWGGNSDGEATGTPTVNSSYTSKGLVVIGGTVLSNITAIAAGNHYSLALKQDGTVVAWGASFAGATNIPSSLGGVTSIAAGGNFALAITTNQPALPGK